MRDLKFQTGRSRTAATKTGGLLVWFASAGCSAAAVLSFLAPRWKCTLLSVAGWQPLGRKENKLWKRSKFGIKERQTSFSVSLQSFLDPPCWASLHRCVGWAFSGTGIQRWCSAYGGAHCCWRSPCEFASLGPGLFLGSKECWPDWRGTRTGTQSIKRARTFQQWKILLIKMFL